MSDRETPVESHSIDSDSDSGNDDLFFRDDPEPLMEDNDDIPSIEMAPFMSFEQWNGDVSDEELSSGPTTRDSDDDDENDYPKICSEPKEDEDIKDPTVFLNRLKYVNTYGSIVLAIDQGYIDAQAVLDWLCEQDDIADVFYIQVYLNLIRRMNIMESKSTKGVYFYDKNPILFDLFCIKCDDETASALTRKYRNVTEEVREKLVLIRNVVIEPLDPTDAHASATIMFKLHCRVPVFQSYDSNTNAAILAVDWLEKFVYNAQSYKVVLERCVLLEKEAPEYYKQVALPAYTKIIQKLSNEGLLTNLSQKEMIELDQRFNNIVDKKLLISDELTFRLISQDRDILAYTLGFPIHLQQPSEKQIEKAVSMIVESGVKSYCETMNKYNERMCKTEMPFAEDATHSNTDDVMTENVYDYPSFDIVTYHNGKYIYTFTRPEFDSIISTGENHWTKEKLPVVILDLVQSRKDTAKKLGFPPSEPMESLINNLLEDKAKKKKLAKKSKERDDCVIS